MFLSCTIIIIIYMYLYIYIILNSYFNKKYAQKYN